MENITNAFKQKLYTLKLKVCGTKAQRTLPDWKELKDAEFKTTLKSFDDYHIGDRIEHKQSGLEMVITHVESTPI